MRESQWTTGFLTLMTLYLLLQIPFDFDMVGLMYARVKESRDPSSEELQIHTLFFVFSLGVGLMSLIKSASWWRRFHRRSKDPVILDMEVLTRSALFILGSWFVLTPILDLLYEVRTHLMNYPRNYMGQRSTVYWAWHCEKLVIGILLCALSSRLANWFVRTRLRAVPLGPDQSPSSSG